MARLDIIEGEHADAHFTVGEEVVLGRSTAGQRTDSFFHLDDSRISRRHARITRRGGQFFLEDLGSANGTALRGNQLRPRTAYELRDGDDIELSSYRLVFYAEDTTITAPHERPSGRTPLPPTADFSTPIPGIITEPGGFAVHMLDQDRMQSEVDVVLDATTIIPRPGNRAPELAEEAQLQTVLNRLQAMCEASIALGVVTDWDQLMQQIMDYLFTIFPAADRAFILLREKRRDTLVPVVTRQRLDVPDAGRELALSLTIVQDVITHKQAILSVDTLRDSRFNTRDSIINLPIRSVMCAPLLVGEEVLGIVQVDTNKSSQAFNAEDLHLLTGISAQAAIAVKNAQRYKAVGIDTAQRTSLQRYFSPHLVDMLMSGDLSTELGGRTYHGTVLFADIIGFTATSEAMTATEVVGRLRQYGTSMQRVIYDNGGNVDTCSNDDIMAFWSVPQRAEDDERNAVRTGIQMQAQLWPVNLQLEKEGQPPIYMGVGIHTGEFVAGNIGSQEKIEFTLIGDTVNLAARLVKLASRYQVLVSATTWEPIKHLVSAVQLPSTRVKGKSQPVSIYSIRAVADRTGAAQVLALPCVLRDPHGRRIGRGVVTGSTRTDAGLHLTCSTEAALTPETIIILQPLVPEYHQRMPFSARVESCTTEAPGEAPLYALAQLTVTQGDAFLAFMNPGSCLVTTHTWHDLRRT